MSILKNYLKNLFKRILLNEFVKRIYLEEYF